MTLPSITLDPQKIAALSHNDRHLFDWHLHHLSGVLKISAELVTKASVVTDDDIIIDCDFCCGPRSDQWFMDNYGPLWQAAKYFTCGWPGLDCSCGGAGGS